MTTTTNSFIFNSLNGGKLLNIKKKAKKKELKLDKLRNASRFSFEIRLSSLQKISDILWATKENCKQLQQPYVERA